MRLVQRGPEQVWLLVVRQAGAGELQLPDRVRGVCQVLGGMTKRPLLKGAGNWGVPSGVAGAGMTRTLGTESRLTKGFGGRN